MAFNVGAASIIVKVITLAAQKQLSGLQGELGKTANQAIAAREKFQALSKTSYTLGPAIATIVGAISAVIGSLGSLIGAAGAAGASLVVLGNVFAAFGLAMLSAKIAMGGVMQALGQMGKGGGAAAKNTDAIRAAQERLAVVIEGNQEALINANKSVTEAQNNLNDAFAAGREELQQLGFAAESAALAELGAGLDLERAREQLARVQDLPPNSRIRREAELAFAQAELQYREAVDTNADLAAEQEKYAESGIEGTEQVIRAREQLAEAEANLARVVRDGLRQQIEAERALTAARQQSTAGGGADPFANLTKSQKDFVKEIYKLKPLFKDVQEQVAAAFLPLLGNAIKNFAKNVLPTVGDGLAKIGGELGKAAESTSKFLSSAEGLDMLDKLFSDSAKLIGPLSNALGQLFQAFIKIINAAAPVAETFVDFIGDAFTDFNKYLDDLGENKLTDFFTKAGESAAVFGDLFGEIFRYIGQLIGVNLGKDSPGYDFVKWMGDGLKAANDLRDSNLFGPGGLKDYFYDVNENTKSILSSLGALGRVFLELGTNQNIGKTFDILKEGAPALGSILNKLADSGPSFAGLIVLLTKIADAFTDSKQIDAYFDTLSAIAQVFLDIVESEPVQAFLQAFGPLLATILALNTAWGIGAFAVQAFTGSMMAAGGALVAVETAVTGAFTALAAANPIVLGIVAAVAALAIGIKFMNDGFESTKTTTEEYTRILEDTSSRMNVVEAMLKKDTWGEYFSSFDDGGKDIEDATRKILNNLGAFVKYQNEDFFTALSASSRMSEEFGIAFDDVSLASADAREAIQQYGEDLAAMPLETALAGFRRLTEEQGLTEEGTLAVINLMPEMRTKLEEVAAQAGLTATDSNLVAIAMGGIGDAALEAAGLIPSLTQELSSISQGAVDSERAQINMNNALRDAKTYVAGHTDALKGNQKQVDGAKTELLDYRDSILKGVQAIKDEGGDTTKYFEKQRKILQGLAEDMGYSTEEAEAYIEKILGTPEEIQTVLKQKVQMDTTSARQEVQSFANYVTTQFRGKLPTAIATAVSKYIQANYSAPIARSMTGRDGTRLTPRGINAIGNMYSYGGEGIYSGRYAGIHKFAEPETGWEAYISGRKGSEGRNRAILKEAAGRLGMNMGSSINITVNPSPGMNEVELASLVSQQITKTMNRGSIR
jgi:hypothetical protein